MRWASRRSNFRAKTDALLSARSMAAHVLGYVDSDGNGQVGMEQALDKRLISLDGRAHPSVLSIDAACRPRWRTNSAGAWRDSSAKGAAASCSTSTPAK